MINVSQAFRDELANDNRNYQCYATITLADDDQTVISVTNDQIWTGGWKFEESTTNQGTFDVGAFVLGKLTLVLNNIYDDYTDYVFEGATVVASIGLVLPDESIEAITKGVYIVTEVTGQNTSLITIECLDFGMKFNKFYSDCTLTYPATLSQIVTNACADCGIVLGTQDFPYKDFVINTKPTDETLTYGGVISAVAQIIGCYAKMSYNGALIFNWYQEGPVLSPRDLVTSADAQFLTDENAYVIAAVEATNQDMLDGNILNTNIHRLDSISTEDIAINDVTITGVRIICQGTEENVEYLCGEEGYVIEIEGNPLIEEASAEEISQMIGGSVIGLTFRPMQMSILSDPTIEAGDRAYIINRKNRVYVTYINNLSFTVGSYEQISCEAETVARNNFVNYSASVKVYQQLRQTMQDNRASSDENYQSLSEQIAAITGGEYVTEEDFEDFATEINATIADIQSQISGSIEQWYGAYIPTAINAPASDWTTQELKEQHQGDVFVDTSTGYAYRWLYISSTWQWSLISDTDISTAISTATAAENLANVKRRNFLSQPTPPYDYGDIWMQGASGDILTCTYTLGRADGASYVASDWTKQNKYTDNTVANQALSLAQNHTHSNYATTGHTHTNITTYDDGSLRGIGSTDTNGRRISMFRGSDTVGRLVCHGQLGNNTTYSNWYIGMTSSDRRMKKNITDTSIENALAVIQQMKIRQFDWKDGRHQDIGFIADELEDIDASLTIGGGVDGNGTMNIKSIEVLPLIAYLTKGIQELTDKVATLEAYIEQLERR